MLRVGLVGCGNIGTVHSWALWALRKTGVVELSVVAVCDADAEKAAALAKPHDASVLEVEQLLDRVDVVYICTPTAHHIDVIRGAVERGVAIFCEKPLAPSLQGAEEVASLLAKVPHQVGLVLRAAPVFEELKRRIDAGTYGRPMAVMFRNDQYFPIQGRYASTWRADRTIAGAGTLIEHSIHDVDVLRWLLGDPSSVTCRTSCFFGHAGIEDVATVTFSYDDGKTANLLSIWHQVLSRQSTRRFELFCEDAMLWTDNDNTGPLHIETSAGAEVFDCPLPSWTDDIPVPAESRTALGPYAEASRRFLAALSTGSPDASDALAAHQIVDACYRSAERDGAVVKV